MKSICPITVVLLALSLAPMTAGAQPCGFWLVDWHAWRATSSVPFAPEMMRVYYVPRMPACGSESLYWVGPPCRYAPEVSDGLEPAEFEHLGQIPNDLLLENSRPSR